MRRFYAKLLLASVLSLLSGGVIFAEGPRSTSPANGETIFASDTNPVTRIVINCPSDQPTDIAKVQSSGGNATLSKGGVTLQTLPPSQARVTSTMTVINQITYDLTEGVFEPGEYKFSVPANTIVYEMKGSETKLDAFEITFTILDANSMIVTPGNRSVASPLDLTNITIQYTEGTLLQLNKLDKISITQTVSTATNTIATYSIKIKGQTIFLESDDDYATIASRMKKTSSAGNLMLTIPAGTWSVNGEENIVLNYEYLPSGYSLRNITLNPPPGDTSYTVDQLRNIKAHFTTDMSTNASDFAAILQQKRDNVWGTPKGCTSTVYYRIDWTDKNNAVLSPRKQSTSYTQSVDELESGEYRFLLQGTYVKGSTLASQDITTSSYWIKGATEAAIIKQTPEANSAVRATDWDNIVFEFSSEMKPNAGEIIIKNADGQIVKTIDALEADMGEDAHTASFKVNIPRGTAEAVYTVEVPEGLLKQNSGSELPSAAANFTITVGKYVKIEDNPYPKYTVDPAPADGYKVGATLQTWTFTYYGADAVEIGTGVPTFMKGATSVGGSCTVTTDFDDDDFPRVTVKFQTSQMTTSGNTYQLIVPADAWTVSRGEKVYPSEAVLTYKVNGLTNTTSRNVEWSSGSTFSPTSHSSTVKITTNIPTEMDAETAANTLQSVSISISPSDSGFKSGTGAVGIYEVTNNTVGTTAIATYTKPNLASASEASYETSGLTADKFSLGKMYAFKIASNAIQIGYKGGLTGSTNKTADMSGDLICYFKIAEAVQGSIERELTLLNTSEGRPRVRLDHIELAAATDNETYGFAIAYRKSGMYIGDKDGRIVVDENEGNPVYAFSDPVRKGNVINYKINPSVTVPGDYTLVVPSGCFAIDGVDTNKEFRRSFTIRENKPDWSIPLYSSPQSNSSEGVVGCEDNPIRGFSEIVLTYPEGIKVKAGEGRSAQPSLYTVEVTKNGDSTYEIATPVDFTTMTLYAEDYVEENVAAISFDPPLTQENTYKLVVPKESFLLLGAFDEYVPVEGYTTYFTIRDVTGCEISPAPNTEVLKLSDVTLDFNKCAIATAQPNPDVRVSVFDENGREVKGYSLSVAMDGNKGVVSISPAITKAGKYRIAVPEGRFLCQASANDTPESSLAYDLWYTVVDPSIATVTPAAETVMTKLETISVEFEQAVRVAVVDTPAIKVLNDAGNEMADYAVSVAAVDDIEYTLTISPAITDSGNYSIVIPAGTFACKRTPDGDTRNNEEYVLPFEVKNPTDSKITPTSGTGKAMAELSKLTVTYANAKEVDRGAGAVTLFAADGVTPLEGHTATAEASDDSNFGTITIEPAITESGTYKILVGAGTFLCKLSEEDEEGLPSRERTLTYIVKNPTTITAITPAAVAQDLDKLGSVTFTFASDVVVSASATPEVTVVDEEGKNVLTEDNITVTLRVSGNNARVQFAPAITRAGNLTVTVPSGTFSAKLSSDDKVVEVGEQVLSYKVVDPAVATISPLADSLLPMIETVTVKFDNAAKVDANATAAPKVLDEAGEEMLGYNFTATAVKDNEYTLTVSPAITTTGKYSIVIPAGAFACKLTAYSDARESKEYVLPLEVKNPTDIAEVLPAADSENMDKLEGITFTFADGIIITAASTPAVTVEDEEGNNVLTADDIEVSLSVEGNVARVEFEPAITRAGNLTVTVPSGTFSAQLSAEGGVVAVGEQKLNYHIKDRSPMKFDVVKEGQDILVLDNIIITFHEATNVEFNPDVTEAITVTHAPTPAPAPSENPESVRARVAAREGEQTYAVTAEKHDTQSNAIILKISPRIEVAGETTVHIPEGKIIADGQALPEASPVFAVKGDPIVTWVESVYGDGATFTVVTMTGVVIMKDVPADELKNLASGMYIINGKAVLIK